VAEVLGEHRLSESGRPVQHDCSPIDASTQKATSPESLMDTLSADVKKALAGSVLVVIPVRRS
jgi:hypothetical protein